MDVIEASYMEVIKNHLDEHVDYSWKATKHDGEWHMYIKDEDGNILNYAKMPSFGSAVKLLVSTL